ncbi:MAG: DUF1428 domain-containing protein [Gemmatimonadetes bacterium]|nr:DUF1428 domain-containing protein [Gemmatimonadota bacterium]
MRYVDGFVIPVPKRKLDLYRKMARLGRRVWLDHGALEYRECVGEDLEVKGVTSFQRLLRLKPGETAMFAWIVFKSRAHRDRVNARVMKDARMRPPANRAAMPFDPRRMAYGGFQIIVAE